MKRVLGALVFATSLIYSCTTGRDIQVEKMNVHLIRIDTVFRQSGTQKLLTWEAENRVRFTSIEPLESSLAVGTTMGMLIRR
jgi:hypothetical protein